jgi:hypothetical protein
MEDAAIRRALVRPYEDGRDLDQTHEIYHDDEVLQFPQSGERFADPHRAPAEDPPVATIAQCPNRLGRLMIALPGTPNLT